MKQTHKSGTRRGFSLVEMLIVCCIITLLVSIAMPVIARARSASQDVGCLSNLRQLGAAFQVYQSEYDVYPCPTTASTTMPPASTTQFWSQDWIYPIIYRKPVSTASRTDSSWLPRTVFECPASRRFELPIGETALWRGYGMSARLADSYSDTVDHGSEFKHPNRLTTPSETSLLMDCTQPWSGTLVVSGVSQLQAIQEAEPRHNNWLNVLFADYHVEARSYDSIPTVQGATTWQKFWGGI